MSMILLLGAGLLCAGHRSWPCRSSAWSPRSGAASRARWPPSRRWTRAPDVLKAEIERPFAERVIAPAGRPLVGLGRKLVRADTAQKIQYRLNIAGNPPAWDVNRILGLKVLGPRRLRRCSASSTSSARTGRSTGWSSATALVGRVRLRPAQHPALQRRAEARDADAQRAAGRAWTC